MSVAVDVRWREDARIYVAVGSEWTFVSADEADELAKILKLAAQHARWITQEKEATK